MNIETQNIPISKLIPNTGQIEGLPKNPRLIKDERFEQLKQSIERSPEFLNVRELIVYPFETKFVVIGGNQRLKAAKELKIKTLPCKVLDIETPIEKLRELTIMDNNSFGENDNDILLAEWDLAELSDWGALPTWEDASEQSDNSLNSEAKEDDYIEPADLVCDVKLGDLIEIGQHRLLCGDSTKLEDVERVMQGEKADMVFTSPPYNANSKGFDGKFGNKKNVDFYIDNHLDNKTTNEYIKFNFDVLKNIKSIGTNELVVLYNINYNRNSPDEYIDVVAQIKSILPLVETIIWEKQLAISLAGDNLTRIIEFIFVLYAGKNGDKPKINKGHNDCIKNLWKISNINANQDTHKACFPIELCAKGIELYAINDAIIFEPFCGSGSTMVAAHQLNRKCYGLELSEKYCQVIIDRMKKLDSSLVIKINGVEYAPSVPF